MADFTVTDYASIVNAINTANGTAGSDNLRFANDVVLGPNQPINLTTPAGSGNLRFRAPLNSTATPTLVVQSALTINDKDSGAAQPTPQPSFAIGPFRLVIGNGGTDGSLAGNLRADDGGILAFNRSADSLYTGTLSVEDEGNALLNYVSGTTVTFDGTAGTNGLALRASQSGTVAAPGTASAYELEIGGAGNGIISGIIADSGLAARANDLNKTGAGTWTFSGVNTYVGTTTVSEGTLVISSAAGLGATIGAGTGATAADAGTIVEDGATLALKGGISIGAEVLSLEGDGVGGAGAFENVSGNNTFGGNITLTGDTLVASDAGTLTLSGTVGGAFGLTLGGAANGFVTGSIQSDVTTVTKEGDGTWSLSGNNAYAGGSNLNDGTLELGTLSSAGTGAITFGDDAQTLQIDVAGTLGNTIAGFGVDDVIDLRAIDSNGATFTMVGDTLTVSEAANVGSDSSTITVGPAQSGYRYVLGSDGNGGTTVRIQDAVAPDAPDAPTLTANSDTGVVGDGVTRRVRPTFSGTAEAGSTVTLYEGSSVLGSAVAGIDGTYQVNTSVALGNGDHTVTVTATDAAGNASTASDGTTITIDTIAPTKPAAPVLSASSDTGTADRITADTTPTFTGTVGAGETVTLYDGTTKIVGTATAGLDGSYSVTVGNADMLADGAHNIYVRSTDAAGNTSNYSTLTRVVIDTAAPGAPTAPSVIATSDTGASATDGITRDATPTVIGTAEAGTIVQLYDGDTLVGTAKANGNGAYRVTASNLTDGDHVLTARSIDAAGNQGASSAGTNVTVDTSAPRAPATPSLSAMSDTGASTSDGITSDSTPTFTGTAEAGTTVTLYDDGIKNADGSRAVIGSATAGTDGSYSITAPTLSDGTHYLRVKATDAAGNASMYSAGRRVVIDTQDPDVAIGTSGGAVTQARQTISGTGEAGSRITLADDDTGIVYGSTTVRADGTWSRAIRLEQGDNEIGATAVDKAGNTAASDEITLTYEPAGTSARSFAVFSTPAAAPAAHWDGGFANACSTPPSRRATWRPPRRSRLPRTSPPRTSRPRRYPEPRRSPRQRRSSHERQTDGARLGTVRHHQLKVSGLRRPRSEPCCTAAGMR